MRQCDNWYQIAHKIENYKAQPLMADGAVLSRQQVNELADEYATFHHENPAEFEKMNFELFVEPKIESGEFEKGSFKFTQQTFKGEQQYECIKTKSENGKKISVHYIAKQNPSVVAEPGTLGTFVYQIKGSYSNPKSPGHEIVFIDLILPRMKSKEKPVHA
jgi:hypothetical protein